MYMETKSIGDYSWNEIEEMKDFISKEELKRKFLKEKEELLTNRVLRKCAEEYFDPKRSLYENYWAIYNLSKEYESQFLFPGHIMMLYPRVQTYVASKPLAMHLGANYISRGERYCVYRPLIEDLDTHLKYTLQKSIFASEDSIDFFPQSFREFEEWDYALQNAYYYNVSSSIDFYELSTRLGSDGLTLRRLRDDADTRRLRKYRKKLKELKKEEIVYLKILNTSLDRALLERKLLEIQQHIEQVSTSIYTLECKRISR